MDLVTYLRRSRDQIWDPDAASGLMRFLDPPTSGRILDVGCGTGFFTHMLSVASPNATIVGVDLSAAALEAVGETSTTAHFARADLFRLPFSPQQFDLVVCHIVLTVV